MTSPLARSHEASNTRTRGSHGGERASRKWWVGEGGALGNALGTVLVRILGGVGLHRGDSGLKSDVLSLVLRDFSASSGDLSTAPGVDRVAVSSPLRLAEIEAALASTEGCCASYWVVLPVVRSLIGSYAHECSCCHIPLDSPCVLAEAREVKEHEQSSCCW